MRMTLKNLAILVSLSFSSATAFSADLTPEKQRQYGQAYGSVQGFAMSMDYMRDNCGDTAKDARKVWDARNAVQKVQAEGLFQKVMRREAVRREGSQGCRTPDTAAARTDTGASP